ncbi:Hypothetical predicted protein [Lecanosticta acicola]|uniref:Uncharacterized protein n=1 Tax=Lecanosticta acicola TaxID=111012 RepID=A0AAI9E8J0_9PEZI|nr:Hypothetical predicted protein [Lecanosticta acicola]
MPRDGHAIEPYRQEITERTEAGESCEQVADALRAQGFEVSKKTISRWRVTWGLRKRAPSSTTGRKYPDRKRRTGETGTAKNAKIRGQEARKQEIIERTQRGETAEQIAEALQAQGFELKSGASTIWRLQTTWKLVPYEKDRARGKGKYDRKKQAQRAAVAAGVPGAQPTRPRKKKEIIAPSNPGEVLHYPSNLGHGPKKGAATSDPFEAAPTAYSNYQSQPMQLAGDDDAGAANGAGHVPVNTAADLMSAEFLVDLATSTLTAANRVKELYLARQSQRPMPDSTTHLPPTEEDILAAKQKVREAAAVMHDLAMPTATT